MKAVADEKAVVAEREVEAFDGAERNVSVGVGIVEFGEAVEFLHACVAGNVAFYPVNFLHICGKHCLVFVNTCVQIYIFAQFCVDDCTARVCVAVDSDRIARVGEVLKSVVAEVENRVEIDLVFFVAYNK